jgi:hypothetical protein
VILLALQCLMWGTVITLGVALAVQRKKRGNRRVSHKGAWPRKGYEAPTNFWNQERRGHTECR